MWQCALINTHRSRQPIHNRDKRKFIPMCLFIHLLIHFIFILFIFNLVSYLWCDKNVDRCDDNELYRKNVMYRIIWGSHHIVKMNHTKIHSINENDDDQTNLYVYYIYMMFDHTMHSFSFVGNVPSLMSFAMWYAEMVIIDNPKQKIIMHTYISSYLWQ